MIVLVCARGETEPMGRFIRGIPGLSDIIRVVTYSRLLSAPRALIAHYIFTDPDHLTPEYLERSALFASAVTAAEPQAQILNHPLRVLERYALVRTLFDTGLGAFDMARLDERRVPRFPVFIRREAGTGRAETPLLHDDREFHDAVADLEARGRTRKGRVAVEFVDTRSLDGRYRKYGVIRIGDRLVPQHLFVADDWCVKGEDARLDAEAAAEELAFVQASLPDADLRRIFDVAGVGYGRLDYAVHDGRLVPFEINTNPSLPRPGKGDVRADRRQLVCTAIAAALAALDRPLRNGGQLRLPNAARLPSLRVRLRDRLRTWALRTPMADWHFRRRRRRRSPR